MKAISHEFKTIIATLFINMGKSLFKLGRALRIL